MGVFQKLKWRKNNDNTVVLHWLRTDSTAGTVQFVFSCLPPHLTDISIPLASADSSDRSTVDGDMLAVVHGDIQRQDLTDGTVDADVSANLTNATKNCFVSLIR